MVRLRFIQALLLTIALTGGVKAWRRFAEPLPDKLRELAEAPLREIFGDEVTYRWPFQVDFNDGVLIRDLRVPATHVDEAGVRRPVEGLYARSVRIQHDRIALAAGRFRPVRLDLEGVRILAHETESGVDLDIDLDISGEGHYEGRLPEIHVHDVDVFFRPLPDSQRLRPGRPPLQLVVNELHLVPDGAGKVEVAGTAHTRGLGQDDTPIQLEGFVSREGGDYRLRAIWDPLKLTPELVGRAEIPATDGTPLSSAVLSALAENLAKPLRQRSIQSGRFELTLEPGAEGGTISPSLNWDSAVEIRPTEMPGLDMIDDATKRQLDDLFGEGALHFELSDKGLTIKSFASELAGGRVNILSGTVSPETGAFHIDFEIKDLRLEDPAVRRALGENAGLFDEFDPHGLVDVFGSVERKPAGEVAWSFDVWLKDAKVRYIGGLDEAGKRVGFPYQLHEVNGRVRIRPDGVFFDDIVGFNRGAEITILGYDEGKQRGWTDDGETGRILFKEEGVDVRLTLVVTDLPIDDEVIEAIRHSDFSELLDEFKLAGTVDKVELDLIKIPGYEITVKTEMRLTLLGEKFVYMPFPLPLEDVRGVVTMKRPVLEKERGRVYEFDVTGWAEGAPVRVQARSSEHESRGRVVVTASGLPLAGAVTDAVLNSPTTGEELGDAWRWLQPRGKADVKLDVPIGDDPNPMHLLATLQSASIRLNAESDAPLEIADLTGRLEVKENGIHLHDVKGTVGGAPVTVQGTMEGGVEGTWDLQAHIENLRLTPSLSRSLSAIMKGGNLLPGGMQFEAGSRMTFQLDIDRPPGEDSNLKIDFVATDLDTVVRLEDGSSIAFSGDSLEVRGDVLRARNLRAEGPGLQITVPDAQVVLGDRSELSGRFSVAMDDYTVSEHFLALLPEGVAEVVTTWTAGRRLRSKALRVEAPKDGPITLRGDLTLDVPADAPVGDGPRGSIEFAPLVIDMRDEAASVRGLLRLRGFSMDIGLEVEDLDGRLELDHLQLGDHPRGQGRLAEFSGRLEGISVSGLSAPLEWTDDVLRIPTLSGRLAGGAVEGHFRLHTAEPISYEGVLTVRDFDLNRLREDLAPTGPEFSGVGTLNVTFQNRSGEARDMTASGSLFVREGDLGDLPVVSNIFTLADELFKAEHRQKINKATVIFTLEREVIKFSKLHLSGPLFDMPGRGRIDLAGTVDVRFAPDFIKSMLLPGVMQLPGLGPVLHAVLREELLYAVRIRGDLDDPEVKVEFLPPLGLDKKRKFAGTGPRKLPRRELPRWFR